MEFVATSTPAPPGTLTVPSPELIDRCRREARKDGVYAGLTSGLIGAVIGSRGMGFTRNKTLLCGLLTGVLSGYYFTQAFTSSRMKMAEAHALSQAHPS